MTDQQHNCPAGKRWYPGGIGSPSTNAFWPLPIPAGCYNSSGLGTPFPSKGGQDLGKIAGGAAGVATDLPHFLALLTDPHTHVRIGEVLFGSILVAAGIFAITKAPQRVETSTRTATRLASYTPQGKAAKTAQVAKRAGKVSEARAHGTQVGRASGKKYVAKQVKPK